MTPFEYLITLVSVLVGLALVDLATSLHRLLRARRRVHWDALPLAGSLLAVLAVLQFWWTLFDAQELGAYGRITGFLPLMAQLLLLYLLNAAALPDAAPEEGIDLQRFYNENGRYFWLLYAAYVFLAILMNVAQRLATGASPAEAILAPGPNHGVLASFLLLAFVRHRGVHAVVMAVWFVVFVTDWWGLRLAG